MIRQSLSGEAPEGQISALFVIDTKFGASVLPEIELGQIAVQMLNIDVLIDADKAALQDGKEAFQRVGVRLATGPLELGMIDPSSSDQISGR